MMNTITRALARWFLGGVLAVGIGLPAFAAPPTVAFAPWNSNDAELAAYAHAELTRCLSTRQTFQFLDADVVRDTVERLGIDLQRVLGISDDEHRRIAQALGTDYVMSGAFSVLKSLTFSGWRKDISADVRLHRGADGTEAGYWQTTTGFSFVSSNTALDPRAMSDRATGEFCDAIAEAAATGFAPQPSPADQDSGFGSW